MSTIVSNLDKISSLRNKRCNLSVDMYLMSKILPFYGDDRRARTVSSNKSTNKPSNGLQQLVLIFLILIVCIRTQYFCNPFEYIITLNKLLLNIL